jgi:MFS superfamily sulfate permease-like transporter
MSSPWLLVISKHPEFYPSGQVVPGQCEPFTSSWRLRLYNEGEEIVLLTGTYYELSKIQKDCDDKSIDEIKEVAEQAKIRLAEQGDRTAIIIGSGNAPEDDTTLAGDNPGEATQLMSTDELQGAIEQMRKRGIADEETRDDLEVPPEANRPPFEASMSAGVFVASVVEPSILEDTPKLQHALQELMKASGGALVIDLQHARAMSHEAANVVGRFTFACEKQGRYVALANVSQPILDSLENHPIEGTLLAYLDRYSAVTEARAFVERQSR